MKRILLPLIVALASGMMTLSAQTVNIPDANFKAYLLGNTDINTNGDNEIQESEAASYTGDIECNDMGIADLTGIEAFTSLTSLVCSDNQLIALDVTNNTALEYLECSYNQLIALDVSSNVALEYLWCGANQLTALDVSSNIALEQLYCSYNQLTTLNAQNGNNIYLTEFYASSNPNLTCIQVDDAAYSTANWTGGNFQFDAETSFSENCSTSVNDINEWNYFSIYPNPTRGIINFSAPTNVQLLSLTGQVISENKNVSTLNLSDQPSGIYLLILSDRKGQVIQRSKVMKE